MKVGTRFTEDIEVKSNLFLTVRERGKIVARREGHNIFLDYGREWLSGLIAYSSFSPDTFEDSRRVRYFGFGIGGTRQVAPAFADSPPLSDYGPVGGFTQTDTNPTLLRLERPVRLSGSSGPGTQPGDRWVGQVQAPPIHDTPTSTTFRRLITLDEISYAPYVSVPLSEIGMFLSDSNTNFPFNNIVAYDTFDTLSKTTAFELEVSWTLRFG
jgi:hypothetical protein